MVAEVSWVWNVFDAQCQRGMRQGEFVFSRFYRGKSWPTGRHMPPCSNRRRQPLLFATTSPLIARFGAEFFGSLPSDPGVYFFYDGAGRLLYIGQSGCLKHRLRSYRHVDPDRHPRRTLRLIQRTVDIQWRVCATAAEALATEAVLLLEHRPPFNRAGVWPSAAWWLGVKDISGWLHLELKRESEGAPTGQNYGPLPGNFRAVFGPLARCLYHGMHPSSKWWDFPVGLLNPWPASCQSWRLPPEADRLWSGLGSFVETGCQDYLSLLAKSVAAADHQEFWGEQIKYLQKFSAAQIRRRPESTHRQVPTGT